MMKNVDDLYYKVVKAKHKEIERPYLRLSIFVTEIYSISATEEESRVLPLRTFKQGKFISWSTLVV